MSDAIRGHALSEPTRVSARATPVGGKSGYRILTLSVTDGPEAQAEYDPARIEGGEAHEDNWLAAVEETCNAMVDEAVREEARCWAEETERLYVVLGHTGGGDAPQQTWPVRAFLRSANARAFRDLLTAWVGDRGLQPDGTSVGKVLDPQGFCVACPLDPGFRVDGAVRYTVEPTACDLSAVDGEMKP